MNWLPEEFLESGYEGASGQVSPGSIRRLKRANGFAWEFRYYVEQDGKRVLRSQYFDGTLYRTEKAVRQKVESQLLKLNEDTGYARAKDVTFNDYLAQSCCIGLALCRDRARHRRTQYTATRY